MKLLLDQNISRDLVARLATIFPSSAHVANFGLERATDQDVWDHARSNDFVIVSKDSDFNQMAFLYGAPPKVIWLRIGNCTTQQIEQLLRNRTAEMIAFSAEDQAAVLILGF